MSNLNLTIGRGDPVLRPVWDEYKDAQLPFREDGAILADGVQVASTMKCVHQCGSHFMVKRGSGVERGWCNRCGGPTCGRATCEPCVPFERWLDAVERRATYESRIGA